MSDEGTLAYLLAIGTHADARGGLASRRWYELSTEKRREYVNQALRDLTDHDAKLRAEIAREIRAWARNIHADTSPIRTNAEAEAFLDGLASHIEAGTA